MQKQSRTARAISWMTLIPLIGTVLQWVIRLWREWSAVSTSDIGQTQGSAANHNQHQVEQAHEESESETVIIIVNGGIDADGDGHAGHAIPDPTPLKPSSVKE